MKKIGKTWISLRIVRGKEKHRIRVQHSGPCGIYSFSVPQNHHCQVFHMQSSSNVQDPPAGFAPLLHDQGLLDALERSGITIPTPVQTESIPEAVDGHDLIIQAETGSGKTLAFVLPILQSLRKLKPAGKPAGLIIVPTRELALQVTAAILDMASDVGAVSIIGGASIGSQRSALRAGPGIVVGTPGRILDLLDQRILSLRHCRYFVLDEADEMLSLGFLQDVRAILSRLPRKRQGLFVSATISPRVEMLAEEFLKDAKVISTHAANRTPSEIEHLYTKVEGGVAGKARRLTNVLENEGLPSVIVFCNTKSDTELVEVFLRRRGFNAGRLNSDLSQKERESVLKQLRSGELGVLIATDIAARGIDINDLDLVVNYSLHEQPEMYVHRSGRTGRAGRAGKAISLIGPEDYLAFANVKKTLGIEFAELEISEERKVA